MVCGYIYKIEFPNGKFYVGLTTRTLKERLKEHKKCAMNTNETRVLYKALKKYNMIDTFENKINSSDVEASDSASYGCFDLLSKDF